MKNKKSQLLTSFIIGFGFILTQLSLTLYLPSLPTLRNIFHVSNQWVMITLTITITGYAIGQLLWGSISDYIGRRPTLLLTLSCYIPIAFAIGLTSHFTLFITELFMLGLVAACYTSVGNAIIRELHGKDNAAKAISYIGIAMTIAPSLAPFIGVHLLQWFGWSSIFMALSILGTIFLVGVIFLVPETRVLQTKSPQNINTSFLKIAHTMLSNREFLTYVTTLGLVFGIVMSYYNYAPHFFLQSMHLSLNQFGLITLPLGIIYTCGSITVSHYIKKHDPNKILRFGITVCLMGTALLLLRECFELQSLISLLSPLLIMMLGLGLSIPTAKAGAMTIFKQNHGTAASLMKVTQTLIALLCTMIASLISSFGGILPAALLLFILSTLAFSILFIANGWRRLHPDAA